MSVKKVFEVKAVHVFMTMILFLFSGCGNQESPKTVLTADIFLANYNQNLSDSNNKDELSKCRIGELTKANVADDPLPFDVFSSRRSSNNCYYNLKTDKTTGKIRSFSVFVEGNRYSLFQTLAEISVKSMNPGISPEDLSRIKNEIFLSEENRRGKCTLNGMIYTKTIESEGYSFSIEDENFPNELETAYAKIAEEKKKASENETASQAQSNGATVAFRPPDTVNAPGLSGVQHLVSPLPCDGKYWYIDYTLSKIEVQKVGTSVGIVSAVYFPNITLCAFDKNMNWVMTYHVGSIYPKVYDDGSMEYFWGNPADYNPSWGKNYNLTQDKSISIIGDNSLPMPSIIKLALAKWIYYKTGTMTLDISGIPNDNNNVFYSR